ncbi:fatty acyl-AMP ligase [Streptomyces sp. ISL-96]|uniref:fatty acyl-AMP ligase n=1 Tax=Streptomyces sp. ISL-96 TaxID=2819191 RepID=UPI001BEC652F|nr:fatty acyl-AMP ligase [Streptomyces sp. ISL-96]MBT2491905.1 fatty acyl-AMP ligase [Streptomyces sp. ISL-96]
MISFDGYVSGFRRRVAEHPHRVAVRFCPAGSTADEEALSYAELDRAARSVAQWLRPRTAPGQRALLSFHPGTGFIRAFLGCLYAGVIPVPVPAQGGHRRQDSRAHGIEADSGAGLILDDALLEEAAAADLLGWTPPAVMPRMPAFLQYTSGSTSDPKGVIVSHAALVHNIGLMSRSHGWQAGQTWCSWLPAYHDMGLIAMMLTPLYLGGTAVLMPPTEFLKRPVSWLRLIDRTGAAISCAPNFAYELCARQATDEQIAELDLSRWTHACNGAEPVDAATLERFAERFAPAGFRPEALLPGYGLAESTLFVTGTRVETPPVVTEVDAAALAAGRVERAGRQGSGQPLVSSGIIRELEVRIVDPETSRVLPDHEIGEIWIRGDSLAEGYWGRPEETARTFGATAEGHGGGFLRTGDLGALSDGELYVTGRIKEMIIVHGRNLYPHDIERELTALDEEFGTLPAAAFAVPDGPHEEIVVVQELRARRREGSELSRLATGARTRLAQRLGVRVGAVQFVRVGEVRRTTSGKIQRTLMRELYLKGALAQAGSPRPGKAGAQ